MKLEGVAWSYKRFCRLIGNERLTSSNDHIDLIQVIGYVLEYPAHGGEVLSKSYEKFPKRVPGPCVLRDGKRLMNDVRVSGWRVDPGFKRCGF